MSGGREVIHVLGTAQDAGVPHLGCVCAACAHARAHPAARRLPTSIGIAGQSGRILLVDATLALTEQAGMLMSAEGRTDLGFDGILLTHAHVGHILGLALLGKEGARARSLPTFVTERMAVYLRTHRPWAWLIARGELALEIVAPDVPMKWDGMELTPFSVPHRGEDTDTVGVHVSGSGRSLCYVPDTDVWSDALLDRIRTSDTALLDGTFYSDRELPNRTQAEIPHPPIADSLERLMACGTPIAFTHLNHSNPLLDPDPARRPPLPPPCRVVQRGEILRLGLTPTIDGVDP